MAPVKIHAKQTKDGNNRRVGGRGEERRDGSEETDGELDSQTDKERGNEFLAEQIQVTMSSVPAKKRMIPQID